MNRIKAILAWLGILLVASGIAFYSWPAGLIAAGSMIYLDVAILNKKKIK